MIAVEDILKIKNVEPDFNCRKLPRLTFSGVSIDSREIEKDDIFIAIKGENHDGHDFIEDVVEKGIKAAIVSYEKYPGLLKLRGKIHFFKVGDTLKALQELGRIHREKFNQKVLAITGTNGKTTTKEMLYSILSLENTVLKSPGNFNNQYGVPLTLLKLTEEHEIAIIEMGASKQGDIQELCEIAEPDIGIITCIGRGHLEYFGSIEKVAATKAELLEYIDDRGITVINADDNYLKPYITKGENQITFSMTKGADIHGRISEDSGGFSTIITINDEIQVRLQVPGRKNVMNALGAAAASRALNVSFTEIKKGLEKFQAFSGRLQIRKTGDFIIIDDTYNSNPESLSEALDILVNQNTSGKKFAVLGDMLELGGYSEREHRAIGKLIAKKGIGFVFTYGNYSRFISEESKKLGVKNSLHFDDKSLIVRLLNDLLGGDDIVLVKGSRGMKMEDVVNKLIEAYGDKR